MISAVRRVFVEGFGKAAFGLVLLLALVCADQRQARAQGAGSASAPAVVREIVVDGTQRIEASTVQSYLTVRPGEVYSEEQADRSMKALFATGLFSDVNMRMSGGSLLVRVTENPVINRVVLEGNRKIRSETLNSELTLKPRQVYTRAKVQADTQRLQQVYRRGGRFAATVEPKVIQLPQNRVDVVFEISEGALTGVSRIRFVGNRAYSDSTLRENIRTKESVWWRFLSTDDNYDPDRLTFDREQLRKFYLARGFVDFQVLNAVAELAPSREAFFITFTVEEGDRYRFGKIDITSDLKAVDVEPLRQLFQTKQGEIYNADLVEKTVQELTQELGRFGFAFVDVKPEVKKNKDTRTVDLTYVIGESPRVYVERIDIVGNVRTLDKVIRREFRLVEGDAFNSAKLRRTRTRVKGLNFFEKAEITESKGSAPDKVVLTAEVAEKSTGELSFGLGYSTSDSVLGDVAIRERNLLGRGQDLRLGVSLSGRRQQADLSFTEPYFLDRELAAGFDLQRRRLNLLRRSGFVQTTTGMRLRAGFPITEYLGDTVFYSLKHDEIDDVESNQSRFVKAQQGNYVTSSIGNIISYDRRDDKIDPTKGYIIKHSQELAGLGGTERFFRHILTGANYFPIAEDVVASAAVEGGVVYDFGEDLRLPDRFFLGGDSFAGFRTGGVGPRETTASKSLGGKYYYKGEVDLAFPIGLPNDFGIKGRVFTIAGSLWESGESGSDVQDVNSMRISSGVGLSWKSPFGLIRVDVAKPVRKEDFDITELVRINFGSRF